MRKGQKMTDEQKLKVSISKTGTKASEETKRKLSKLHRGKNNIMYGKKHTDETKEKMRNAKKNLSDESKINISKSKHGSKNPMYGKKHSPKTIELIREKKMGENNWNWKGGIACEPYCEQWLDKEYKKSIMERDGNVCLNPECNKTSKNTCLHHIDYNKKNCHPLNLITICISCNSKANKNRRWHREWYKAIINKRYVR